MKSPPPLKTYARRRKARAASTSARLEEMEQMIHKMASRQAPQYARSFSSIRAAIGAVEEVSIGFTHTPPLKSQSNLY